MTDEITPQSDNWRIGTPSRNGLKANTKLMTQTDALLMSRGFAPLANDRERCIAIAASMKTVRDDIKGLAGALALAIHAASNPAAPIEFMSDGVVRGADAEGFMYG